MIVLIKGAGDIASGIAARLYRAGMKIVMIDLPMPTAIRRTVCFSEAIRNGGCYVEDIYAEHAHNADEAVKITDKGMIAVMADPEAKVRDEIRFDAEIDAILAKKNLGTRMDDCPVVIGIGPGFTAGVDCHACVETKRGHDLGRVIYRGSPEANTGIPGNIGGYTYERVLRAPCAGVIVPLCEIGDHVDAGDTAALVDGVPMKSVISGVVRGMLPKGTTVTEGMKSGDVDPRDDPDYCRYISDKALAVGGGALEAVLHFSTWERR